MIKREHLELGVIYYFLDRSVLGTYIIKEVVLFDYHDIDDKGSPIKPYNLYYTRQEAERSKNRRINITLELIFDIKGNLKYNTRQSYLHLLHKIREGLI